MALDEESEDGGQDLADENADEDYQFVGFEAVFSEKIALVPVTKDNGRSMQ